MIHTVRHKNIPFFTPHSGCKNNCVFCSQTKITGYSLPAGEMREEAERLDRTVLDALPHLNGTEAQIAFFGGSFTGIERERMVLLLKTAYKYVEDGSVCGIRLSTRPDYIDKDILETLKRYGVTDIELGLQSTDGDVLRESGRGHGRDVCFESAALINEYGFRLGGQMMIGLPLSTPEKERRTARDIVSMGAVSARIYPTVVFTGTPLYDMALNGSYKPLTNEDAAERSTECLKIFKEAGVEILRIGLHASEELKKAPFGANHPAMGELVYSALAYGEICSSLEGAETKGRVLCIYAPEGSVSAVAGHGGENRRKLYERYGFRKIRIFKDNCEKIKVEIKEED